MKSRKSSIKACSLSGKGQSSNCTSRSRVFGTFFQSIMNSMQAKLGMKLLVDVYRTDERGKAIVIFIKNSEHPTHNNPELGAEIPFDCRG